MGRWAEGRGSIGELLFFFLGAQGITRFNLAFFLDSPVGSFFVTPLFKGQIRRLQVDPFSGKPVLFLFILFFLRI